LKYLVTGGGSVGCCLLLGRCTVVLDKSEEVFDGAEVIESEEEEAVNKVLTVNKKEKDKTSHLV